MRGKTIRGAWLLVAWVALAPGWAWGQPGVGGGFGAGYAPADPQLPLPLGSTRPEDGGPYVWGQYVLFRQTNPLKDQLVAVRGFIAVDDSVPGVPPNSSGVFVGSRSEALNVMQASGPNGYNPGFEVGFGYKFKDGSSLSLDWLYLSTHETRAVATLAPPGLNVRGDFADSFLTSYVFNFPNDYAGPPNKIQGASPFAAFGIWNGASIMTLELKQRFQQWQMTYREPIYDTECYRLSGLVGPRFAWFWERFKWRTTSLDVTGNGGPLDVGIYTNIVSNRMYGVHAGCSQEWYLGHGFAATLNTEAALFLDSVKERVKYELGDKFQPPQNKRAVRDWTVVPEVQAFLGIKWYPTEFIELQVGYDVMVFFNTIASPRPIDFNYSSLTPEFDRQLRVLDGFRVGMALVF